MRRRRGGGRFEGVHAFPMARQKCHNCKKCRQLNILRNELRVSSAEVQKCDITSISGITRFYASPRGTATSADAEYIHILHTIYLCQSTMSSILILHFPMHKIHCNSNCSAICRRCCFCYLRIPKRSSRRTILESAAVIGEEQKNIFL